MQNVKINLLPRKGAREILDQKWFSRLQRGSFIFLGTYGLLLLLVFGVRFYYSNLVKQQEQEFSQARVVVDSLAAVESQHILVKSKLQASSAIMAQQKSWYLLLTEVVEFIPDELAVSEITLTKDQGLQIGVETRELQELVVILNGLLAIGLQRDFVTDVSLQRVEKTALGAYGFTLLFEVNS